MSIEGSSTVGNQKAVSSDAARAGKAKVASGGASDSLAGAGAGFMALLNSFDPEHLAEGVGSEPLAKDEPGLLLQTPTTPADPSVALFLHQNLPTDLQLLLAQASEVSVDKSNLLQSAAIEMQPAAIGSQVPTFTTTSQIGQMNQAGSISPATIASTTQLAPASLLTQSLAQGMQINPTAMPAPMSVPGTPDNASLSVRSAPDAVVPIPLNERLGASMALAAKPITGLLSSAEAPIGTAVPADLILLQPGGGLGLQPRAFKNKFSEGLAGTAAFAPDSRMLSLPVSTDMANRETSLMGATAASGLGERGAPPEDRLGGKPLFSWAGSGAEGVWGQVSFQPGQSVEAGTVLAGSSTSSMESMMADAVSYWVMQGVEHAALKLEGFGELPLEVSISMQGGEAHIDFRTDHPEIRQLLEGATTQLKDLLKGEGVVLSGVSVGASGQNAAGSPDERRRPGTRQGTVVSTNLPTPDNMRPASLPPGRMLDLFV